MFGRYNQNGTSSYVEDSLKAETTNTQSYKECSLRSSPPACGQGQTGLTEKYSLKENFFFLIPLIEIKKSLIHPCLPAGRPACRLPVGGQGRQECF